MLIKLDDLPEGSTAIIRKIDLPEGLKERILGMGFIPGKKIEVIKKAPLVDPTVYKIGNFRVSLRSSEASKIYVRPINHIPLLICPEGTVCKVSALSYGRRFLNELEKMGISVGKKIHILKNNSGKITIEVDGEIYTVGKGKAAKIFVEVLE